MVDVNTVADYFIAQAHGAGDPITALKLQKLVYYAQAWHLALNDEPLINDRFEAWVHGPVCPALYKRFQGYGWRPIDEDVGAPAVPDAVRGFLDEVWDAYGDINAVALERLTHHEDPWLNARGEIPPDASSSEIIPNESMKVYYRAKLNAT